MMKMINLKFIFVFLFIFYSINIAEADTSIFNASQDSYIYGNTADKNYGGLTSFIVDGSVAGSEQRGLIQFNITGIPENSTINSATLFLYRSAGSDISINLYLINNSWTEGTKDGTGDPDGVTWNNRTGTANAWDVAGGDFNSTSISSFTSTNGNNFISVINAVQMWINGLSNFGFLLDTASSSASTFQSRTTGIENRRPNLNISWEYPAPLTYQVSPANNTFSLGSVNLICNSTLLGVNANANITRFTFYVCNGAGCNPFIYDSRQIFNETHFGTGNKSLTQNWTTTLSEGAHEWTCTVDATYDNGVTVSNVGSPLDNSRRITVDTIGPLVTVVNPVNGSFHKNLPIIFNITLNEAGSTAFYSLNNGVTNISMSTTNNLNYNAQNTSIADGIYTVRFYVNDTQGNRNDTTSSIFTFDSTHPQISVTFPSNNTNTTNNQLGVNFTVSDTNLQSCLWTRNSGSTNITITCGTNITGQTWSEGLNTVVVYANDSANNINSSSVTFRLDTTAPTINYVSPTESSGVTRSRNYIEVNVTATDSGVGVQTILIRLYNSSHTQINSSQLSSPNYINFSGLTNGLYFYNATANDTLGNTANLETRNVTLDTIAPLVTITSPTRFQNISSSTINFNITLNEAGSCRYSLNLGVINYTMTANSSNTGFNATNSSIADRNYLMSAYCNDTAGNNNFTESVNFTKDTTAPSLTLVLPAEGQEFSSNLSIPLNFTVSDSGVGIGSCWFNIDNGVNTTITNCANTTFNTSEGSHTLYLFSNDTLNNIATDSNTFTISLNAPAITLNYPPNNTFFSTRNNIYLNYTATDPNGISACQIWHDLNGTFARNQTNSGVTSGQMNFTIVNASSDNRFNWNVFCNDTLGQGRFSTNNFTFTIDTIYPLITINSISTTTGSQTFAVNFTVNEVNPDLCFFSLRDSSGNIDPATSENTSIGCTQNFSETASDFGVYNLTIYARDKANQENSTTQSFTLSLISPPATGGGGGSTNITVIEITNRTYCGDGMCQFLGNDNGDKEDFFTCDADCPPPNIDTVIFGCFTDDPDLECIFDQQAFQYIGLTAGILLTLISLSTVKDQQGKNVPTIKYVYLSFKKRRRRR